MSKNQLFANLTPVKNISGGSGAETWVVKDYDNAVFVRKFANGDAGRKLKAQTQWLREFKSRIYCPEVLKDGEIQDYYFYDMNYLAPSDTGFQKLLSEDSKQAATGINTALAEFNLIFEHLTPQKNPANRRSYVAEKFLKNLDLAKAKDPAFASMAESPAVLINETSYEGLNEVLDCSAVKNVMEAVADEDLYPIGHGDLTLSNLLVQNDAVAFIDPNPNFELISLEQEYSKVLQSTVVKYELFNDVAFTSHGPSAISYNCGPVRDFTEINEGILINEAFRNLKTEALHFHLAVHLARILPYIKNENKIKSYIYLAEIIKLLNSVASGRFKLN